MLLGIFISEYRKYAAWLLGAVNVLYTIPSIASFVGAGGIDQRPDIINNKERFGDWEIDTIVSISQSPKRSLLLIISGRWSMPPAPTKEAIEGIV